MIKVTIKPESITVQGHANSGPRGRDIVCAAVSVLVQTYLFTLQEVFRLAMDADVQDGYVYIPLPVDDEQSTDNLQRKANIALLTQSLIIGLDGVQGSHPDYVKVEVVNI